MAALLKKRALAEYSQVIQEDPKSQGPKRLRLAHKPKSSEPQLDLSTAATLQANLHVLLTLEQSFPLPIEHVNKITSLLLEHYYIEQNSVVRAKIAGLLGVLAKTPTINATIIEQDLKALLPNEKSHAVKSQLIGALLTIGRALPCDKSMHKRLTSLAVQNLVDRSHLVQCKCLELIGLLGQPTSDESGVNNKILLDYTQQDDPRIRHSAYQALLAWHSRGITLQRSMFEEITKGLKDDYEDVRVVTVKLIWVISQLYPDGVVMVHDANNENTDGIRLVDNGFSMICDMVNDNSMKVRAQAAGLLGSLHLVSDRFLEQTLDKKLMSNMRKKVSAHARQREHFTSGEWSTGNKWADDKPRENVDGEAINLITSGACGAFVHGLEDEYLEVRSAAIDSICELSTHSPNFAKLSQDFIIDMFNDEIESIRLNAIESVRKISQHLLLREDQLDIILAALKDYSQDIRLALHSMLSCTRLGTEGSLNMSVMALLDNLKRYPQDRDSIWGCMRQLGLHHSSLTLPLITELLGIHPYFDTPEPNMDDPAYISVVILVFNAVQNNATILPMFSHHILDHYTYLRNMIPEHVPEIQLPMSPSESYRSTSTVQTNSAAFLTQTIDRMKTVSNTDPTNTQSLINTLIRDLQCVCDSGSTMSATAQCLSLYLQCQLVLDKVICNHQKDCLLSAQQVLQLSCKIEQLFLGLSVPVLACVYQMRLRAHTLLVIAKLHLGSADIKTTCIAYLKSVSNLQRFLQSGSLPIDMFTAAVFAQMSSLESCEPSVYMSCLPGILKHHRPSCTLPIEPTHSLQRASALIIEPRPGTNTNETPLRFKAGLTVAVPIVAKLENITNAQNVHIQVQYPDQSIQLILPRSSDFKQLSSMKYKLTTQAVLGHQAWTEACIVAVNLVLAYDADQSMIVDKLRHTNKTVLELCKPVEISLAPRHIKDTRAM